MKLILSNNDVGSAWVGETGTRSQSKEPTVTARAPTFCSLDSDVFTTEELLMDSQFDIQSWFACRVLGQHRSTQRKVPRGRPDEDALTADIVALAWQFGCYGYRRITALLRDAGYSIAEAKIVIESWRQDYNEVRPHAAIGDRPPVAMLPTPGTASRAVQPPGILT